jgi:hypothetical protein
LLFDFGVPSAIEFDSDSRFLAEEVEDVRPEWMLTPELDSVERTATQALPENALGVRRIAAQPSRTIDSAVRTHY